MQTSTLIKQIGLALAGQMLPHESALSELATNIRKSLFATIVGGVLFASSILLGVFGFYVFLMREGLSHVGATSICFGFLLLGSLLSIMLAKHYSRDVKSMKQQMAPSIGNENPVESTLSEIIAAFAEGFSTPNNAQNNNAVHEDDEPSVHSYYIVPKK